MATFQSRTLIKNCLQYMLADEYELIVPFAYHLYSGLDE